MNTKLKLSALCASMLVVAPVFAGSIVNPENVSLPGSTVEGNKLDHTAQPKKGFFTTAKEEAEQFARRAKAFAGKGRNLVTENPYKTAAIGVGATALNLAAIFGLYKYFNHPVAKARRGLNALKAKIDLEKNDSELKEAMKETFEAKKAAIEAGLSEKDFARLNSAVSNCGRTRYVRQNAQSMIDMIDAMLKDLA